MAWTKGYELGSYGVTANLLRIIAYQQVTLSPNIDRLNKPYCIEEFYRFPGEEERTKRLEFIDAKELQRIWEK